MPAALTRAPYRTPSRSLCSKAAGEKLDVGRSRRASSKPRARVDQISARAASSPATGKSASSSSHNGAGMRVRDGRVEKLKENGALCINCHALDPKEVNVGQPRARRSPATARSAATRAVVKYTYEKIYNAWVYFPCSNMPRLGAERLSHARADRARRRLSRRSAVAGQPQVNRARSRVGYAPPMLLRLIRQLFAARVAKCPLVRTRQPRLRRSRGCPKTACA